MLASFVNAFASRPKSSIALWAVIAIFGVLAFTTLLPREGFPPVDVPIAIAAGGFFVDDQDVVDEQVTAPLAELALELDEVESVLSFSRDSSFSVVANLETGVSSADGAAALQRIIDEGDFPPDAQFFTQSVNASKFLEIYDLLIGVILSLIHI